MHKKKNNNNNQLSQWTKCYGRKAWKLIRTAREWLHWKRLTLEKLWQSYHERVSTRSRYWRISCPPRSFKIWRRRWNITSSFCEAEKRDVYPSYSCHTVPAASFEHLMNTFKLSLWKLSARTVISKVSQLHNITKRVHPLEIIGEIWRPCSKLSDLNRIQFLHHLWTGSPSHPCPRGRAGPARSQHPSCSRVWSL